jgi:hypothetical protein
VAPRRWPTLPVESPQLEECGPGPSNLAEGCPETALCVQTLNNWCACKQYKYKPGSNGREIKQNMERNTSMQNMKRNMQNMVKNMQNMKRNMQNMVRNMQNMLLNM